MRGRRVKRGDVPVCDSDGMLRAAACMDESDHHALKYVWHGQTVREDRVCIYTESVYVGEELNE